MNAERKGFSLNTVWGLLFLVVAILMLMEYFGLSLVVTGNQGTNWQAVKVATAVPIPPAAPSPQMAGPAVSEETVILVAPATATPIVTAVELIVATAVPAGPRIGQGCSLSRGTCPGVTP